MSMSEPIVQVELSLLRHRLAKPVGGSGVAHFDLLLAHVAGADGVAGLGFSYVLGASGVPAFHCAVEIARALVASAAPAATPAERWAELARGFNRTGKGPNHLGLCAIDVALWDRHAKRRAMPLWRCFGDTRPRVPVYQSGGFGAADSIEATVRRVAEAADAGWRAVKLRAGGVARDVPRIEAAVARAERDGLRVMVDINEKGHPEHFAQFAAEARHLPLAWIEEPFETAELRRYRALRAACATPLAAGEHMQGLADALPYLDERLLGVVQPDLAMMGGLSECIRVAREARASDAAVAPHFLPGLFVQVAGAIDHVEWLEEFPLVEPLFDGWPVGDDDRLLAPGDAPGHGLGLSAQARAAQLVLQQRVTTVA